MGKHYETLAALKDRERTEDLIVKESLVTFTKKTDHFTGGTRTLRMFDAAREHEEAAAKEVRTLTTTVDEKLEHTNASQAIYLDALGSKERTNQLAKADVIVDGKVLMTGVPAPLLLAYEKYFAMRRDLYAVIPTLSPGIKWILDTQERPGVYKAEEDIVKHKTEKIPMHKVLVEPTKEHRAELEKWFADVPVGDFVETRQSGMWTPAKKAEVLGRYDRLVVALKEARSRANDLPALESIDGKAAFDFLNKGVFPG
jgi:hypothetical protein